jgi:hypothetical protein
MALLLAGLAALVAVVALDRVTGLGLFKPDLDLQLCAAADAVASDDPSLGEHKDVRLMLPDGTAVNVPTAQALDRAAAVRLLLQLEAMRRECESAVARALATDYLAAAAGKPPAEMAKIAALTADAQKKVSEFLVIEPPRAALVLAALGWPWLGDDPGRLTPHDLDPPFARRPAAFTKLTDAQWRTLVVDASADSPWETVSRALAERHGLGEQEARTLQAYLCRTAWQHAFDSPRAAREACDALQRHAALTPAQARAVLAMAGGRELVRNGSFGFPPLITMLKRRPDLGRPLLAECVRTSGIYEQALQAAADLGGTRSGSAERTLLALGPFGLDALNAAAATRGGQAGPESERLRQFLETQWPPGKNALEILGDDPALWERWFRAAQDVL